MLLMNRVALITFLVVSLLLVVGMAGYMYLFITGALTVDQTSVKVHAETVLFLALSGVVLVLVLFAALFRTHIRVFRELKRVVDLTRFQDINPERLESRLGELGRKIAGLNGNIIQLNERKSLKISAMKTVIRLLLTMNDKQLVFTDSSGTIRHAASLRFPDRTLEPKDTIDREITSLFPSVGVPHIIHQFESSDEYKDEGGEGPEFTCFPVLAKNRELGYIMFAFSKLDKAPIATLPKPPATRSGEPQGIRENLAALFKRRKRT